MTGEAPCTVRAVIQKCRCRAITKERKELTDSSDRETRRDKARQGAMTNQGQSSQAKAVDGALSC